MCIYEKENKVINDNNEMYKRRNYSKFVDFVNYIMSTKMCR